LVSAFQLGKYLSWRFDGSLGMPLPDKLTIKASRFQSENAVISGVFLDREDSPTCGVGPEIKIKKYTNGWDGDVANGTPKDGTGPSDPNAVGLVAQVVAGGGLTWTYVVTNEGAEALSNVAVTDDRPGVIVTCPMTTLAVGQSMTCTAAGTAAQLTSPPEAQGCGGGTAATRPTYVNVGSVSATGNVSGRFVSDEDPSAYCNPPTVKIVKFTNGHDGDNANGVPDPNPGGFTIGSGTVAEVAPNGAITWTYRVTNTGVAPLVNVNVTDDRGVAVTCPKDTLAAGETITCTATGVADALLPGAPNVQGCGSLGTATRPTYANNGTVTAQGQFSGTVVQDSNPSHYCNPVEAQCDLTLKKTCEVVPPPSPGFGTCKGKLQRFTLIWPAGAGTINISGIANDAPGGVVNPGQRVTFNGPFPSNDNVLNISGAANGQSTFHVSCSDDDMDGENTNDVQPQLPGKSQDCGKFEGNGKGNESSYINSWLLDGLVDADGKVLNCSPTTTPPQTSCSFQAQDPPQCGPGISFKPTTLTFQYTGGGCGTQNNTQDPGKTSCSGQIDPTKPVNVTFPGGSAMNVPPGGTFTIPRSGSNTVITLSNSGGSENDGIHTSCSQPLVVGDVFFSLTLVAEDGIGAGRQVNYQYAVTNTGTSTLTGITVEDNKLGQIPGSPIASLAPGATKTLTATALIDKTTTNVAQAYDDNTCAKGDVTSSVTVTVLPPPPCTVTQTFDRIEDDKYKVKVTNTGNKVATLDTLTLNWPAQATYVLIKEVKLDGSIYKASDSNLVVSSGVTIQPGDWTETNVSKRQLDPGETRTLEIVFSKKWPKENCPNGTCFAGTASFAEGCEVDLSQ
jgi:hypothetical protein